MEPKAGWFAGADLYRYISEQTGCLGEPRLEPESATCMLSRANQVFLGRE
jgi:hypothetical protein